MAKGTTVQDACDEAWWEEYELMEKEPERSEFIVPSSSSWKCMLITMGVQYWTQNQGVLILQHSASRIVDAKFDKFLSCCRFWYIKGRGGTVKSESPSRSSTQRVVIHLKA